MNIALGKDHWTVTSVVKQAGKNESESFEALPEEQQIIYADQFVERALKCLGYVKIQK